MKRNINETNDGNDDTDQPKPKLYLKPRNIDFDKAWELMQETVKSVLTLGHVSQDVWLKRFNDIYLLCITGSDSLGERLYKETEALLENHVISIENYVRLSGERNLLKCYYETWNNYNKGIGYLNSLYQYLNEKHFKKNKSSGEEILYINNFTTDFEEQRMQIGELGLQMWKTRIIVPLKDKLVKLVLEEMQKDRLQVDVCNAATIQGIVQSFVYVEKFNKDDNLQLYNEAFETPLLKEQAEYYKREASLFLQESDVVQYVERVIEKLKEENLRSCKFLHPTSVPKITECLLEHMVTAKLQFLYGECGTMVREEREKDLTNMYMLLRAVKNGLDYLVKQVYEHINTVGNQAILSVQGENIHQQFVENILVVYRKFRTMIHKVFLNDPAFVGALDRACCSFINVKRNPNNPCDAPELLAKVTDSLLRKSSRGMSETEIDQRLTDCITIFNYIDDKDVFQKFYSRFLTKRLIFQQSNSMDAEELMINKLKQTCGYEYTCKLHRMFMDISLSRDLNNDFNNFLKSHNTNLGISFSINVLQSGAWPSQMVISGFAVPQQLEQSIQTFETFYHGRFNGRKLTWLHHMCQGELKLNYLKNPYLVTLQTFQMAALLAFEKKNTLTCNEMKDTLQLRDEIFSQCVTSLIDSKLLIADSKILTENTVLELNINYSNKKTKFRITAALQRDTPQEVERTRSSVDKDRIMYLQADIVRIMKSRKVLKHSLLIQEVLSHQSKFMFNPSISMIKKCIETLITKKYIERTESTDEYSYVA